MLRDQVITTIHIRGVIIALNKAFDVREASLHCVTLLNFVTLSNLESQ
jgi:hypothetical protein